MANGSGGGGGGGGGGGSLPDEIVQAIAISNAKSIGEQPAILSNLALANQVLNNNMQQQLMLSQQQAMNQITMTTVAKCISVITNASDGDEATEAQKCLDQLTQMHDKIKPK